MKAQIEHIRKEFHKNSVLAAHGLGMAMSAIEDAEYHLGQLSEMQDNLDTEILNPGMFRKSLNSLEAYRLAICQVEHALTALLSALGDYVEAREREHV